MNQIAIGYFLDFNFIIHDISSHPIIPTNLSYCHEFCNSLTLITADIYYEKKRVGIPRVTKILEVLGWSISLLNLWTTLRQACQSIKLKEKSHSHTCHLN